VLQIASGADSESVVLEPTLVVRDSVSIVQSR
jgi:hypothetical protein